MSGASRAADPSETRHTARMVLPAGGMEAWTQIMNGSTPVPEDISAGSPIVMAWARFQDGTQVAGGVFKSDTPTDFNVKFMWVLDPDGNQYPGWPLDVSDHETFFNSSYEFSLGSDDQIYVLNVVEAPANE